MLKVLVVGQNPTRNNTEKNIAFSGTKSGKTLNSWLSELGILNKMDVNVTLINVFPDRFDSKFKASEIYAAAEDLLPELDSMRVDKILTLGVVATRVIEQIRKDYFELPHPSGLNRKLNDKSVLKEKLEEAKKYIWETV